MAAQVIYPTTRQGVRDLDKPVTVEPPQHVESMRRQNLEPPQQVESRNVGPKERTASIMLGGLLVGFGLGRGDLTGLVIAALSTGLICRGVAGHCAMYEAAGINTAR